MPATWKAELHGLIEAQQNTTRIIRDLRGGPMLEAMRAATLMVLAGAQRNAKVDTGRWRASITPDIRVEGDVIEGIVGSNLQYAPYAHDGRDPGRMPPVDAIAAWVHRKNITGSYSVKTHRRLGGKGKQGREDLQVAWAIARRIAQRGTKGDRALTRSLEANAARIMNLLQRAVNRIIGA